MRISDGSADVCSAVLVTVLTGPAGFGRRTSRRGNTSSMTKRVHVRPRKVGDNAVERSPSARRAFHPRSARDQPGIAQRSNLGIDRTSNGTPTLKPPGRAPSRDRESQYVSNPEDAAATKKKN